MSDDLHSWAMRGLQHEVDRVEAGVRKLATDQARDRLLPVIRERIGDPKRAREAFETFIACDEYGKVDPTEADEKRLHVWLTLAASSEPFRKAVEAPKTEPEPAKAEEPKQEARLIEGLSPFVQLVLGQSWGAAYARGGK